MLYKAASKIANRIPMANIKLNIKKDDAQLVMETNYDPQHK
jgi:hypothetical protein